MEEDGEQEDGEQLASLEVVGGVEFKSQDRRESPT
jgi:hypothetical protein